MSGARGGGGRAMALSRHPAACAAIDVFNTAPLFQAPRWCAYYLGAIRRDFRLISSRPGRPWSFVSQAKKKLIASVLQSASPRGARVKTPCARAEAARGEAG